MAPWEKKWDQRQNDDIDQQQNLIIILWRSSNVNPIKRNNDNEHGNNQTKKSYL